MAGKRTLTVEILGDAKGLGAAAKSVDGEVKGMGGAFDALTGKADSSAAGFDQMNKKVNTAMIGAAAGVAAFALDSIQKFQDTALEAGKFGDTAGIGVEAASRWIAVGDDIGLAAGTMQGAFTKFNLAVANGKPTLDKYGIDIVRAKDGTVDASESFINAATAIGKIKDPTEKAKASQEVFGRSFGEISELMARDANELRSALAGVSDQQVIDEGELAKAREYRDMLDKLGDVVGDFQIALAQKLIPALLTIEEKFESITSGLGKLDAGVGDFTGNGLGEWFGEALDFIVPFDNNFKGLERTFDGNSSAGEKTYGVFQELTSVVPVLGEATARLGEAIWPTVEAIVAEGKGLADYKKGQEEATAATEAGKPVQEDYGNAVRDGWKWTQDYNKAQGEQAIALDLSQAAAQRARDEQDRLNQAARRVEEAARLQAAAWDALLTPLDNQEAFNNLASQFDGIIQKIWDTQAAMDAGTTTQEQGMRDVANEIIATKKETLAYIDTIGGVPVEKATAYLALIDEGKYDEVQRRLEILSRNRTMELSIIGKGGIGFNVTGGKINAFAEGGVIPGPSGAPQLIIAHGGERVLTEEQQRHGGGGDTFVVQVFGAEERWVSQIEAMIRRRQRSMS